MTAGSALLRLVLVLALSVSPLVSSAIAAGQGQWSQFWGNPLNGTVQVAEEEEVGHDASDLAPAEKAVLWFEVAYAQSAEALAYGDPAVGPPEPPLSTAPTPPPQHG